MNIFFVKSQSMTVQGKANEVYKKYGREWSIKEQGGGNGNWLLTKNSDVFVDGVSYRIFVLKFYHKTRLTKNLVKRFREDLESGKVKLEFP